MSAIQIIMKPTKYVWSLKGDDGFEKHMDRLMELSEYMVKRIKQQPDKFYLILEPEMVNVSFWYIPERLRKVPHSPARENELGKVCIKKICKNARVF